MDIASLQGCSVEVCGYQKRQDGLASKVSGAQNLCHRKDPVLPCKQAPQVLRFSDPGQTKCLLVSRASDQIERFSNSLPPAEVYTILHRGHLEPLSMFRLGEVARKQKEAGPNLGS